MFGPWIMNCPQIMLSTFSTRTNLTSSDLSSSVSLSLSLFCSLSQLMGAIHDKQKQWSPSPHQHGYIWKYIFFYLFCLSIHASSMHAQHVIFYYFHVSLWWETFRNCTESVSIKWGLSVLVWTRHSLFLLLLFFLNPVLYSPHHHPPICKKTKIAINK